MKRLEGKVAIITGGASGIGKASVQLFVQEGARVVIADILDEQGEALANTLGENTLYVHTDVSQEADIKALITTAAERFGRLDCLYNNAGIGGGDVPVESLAIEDWDLRMNILLRSVFLGMKYAAPIMKQQGTGSIISTASIGGMQAGYGAHVYSAAKAGVIQLTRSVAMELGESGIRVNCICPGGVATPIFGRAFGLSTEAAEQTVEPLKMALAKMQPIRRAGLPEDIAKAALWLASDDASFVTAQALVVDGGLGGGRMWSVAQAQKSQVRSNMS